MTEGPAGGREPRSRLFVAVELPETWVAGLTELQTELRRGLDPAVRLRWVRPEGVHLTLKFIGEVTAATRDNIEAALAKAVPKAPRLRLESGSLGTFGGRRLPRVLWLGLGGDIKGLLELAERVDSDLHAIGFARETRPLAPHLTLARVTVGFVSAVGPALELAIARISPPVLPAFDVEQVSLMRSHLGPGGARYERLAAFPR
jgi:2'-5' RNA ligase